MKFSGTIVVLCCLWSTLCCVTTSARAATITVQNTNDSGPGSLRQAVMDAADGDTINFAPSVTGTITLTSERISFSDKSLDIVGPGTAKLTISGNNERGIFSISGINNPVSISGLTLANSLAEASGTNAIAKMGDLAVSNCAFRNNRSTYGEGGAITCIFGTLTITRSTFSNNYSFNQGGAIHFNQGILTLDQCMFTGNTAGYYGGAIYSIANILTATNCIFDNNSAPNGGAVWFVRRHVATEGFPTGSSSISQSTFTHNTAIPTPNDSLRLGIGGAILGEHVTLDLCTFSGNKAEGDGGGAITGDGVTVNSCTVAGNSAPNGSGGGVLALAGGSISIYNSIIAGNTAASAPDCGGAIISQDYNIIQSTSSVTISGTTTHDKYGVDPLLGPLQNNGGLTQTRALLAGSPAIDAGDPATAATTDQRGLPRVKDGDGNGIARADIGAFEVQSTVAVGGRVSLSNGVGIAGASVTLGGLTVQSNSAGYYSFVAVPPGRYTIQPAYQNYVFAPISRVLYVATSSISGQNFVGGYNISGRIYNTSGVGLANVKVMRSGSTTPVYTNGAGYYTFTTLVPGTYTIMPSQTGTSFSPSSRTVDAGNSSVSSQNFVASSGYSITGRIATSAGTAIAGVTVTMSESGATAVTNGAGYFTFNNIANGTYTLVPGKSGITFTPTTKTTIVNGANVSDQNFIGANS